MSAAGRSIGEHLRNWRRRRLSQFDLALEAEVSARHLSYVETGRASPSREMVLRLAEQLEVPLRERNAPLLAIGRVLPLPSMRMRLLLVTR
jgi:transcriptional regulator with XRE-family HTH domain